MLLLLNMLNSNLNPKNAQRYRRIQSLQLKTTMEKMTM